MIKRIAVLLGLIFLCNCGLSQLEGRGEDFNLTLKQGMVYLYEDKQVKNYSCLELIKTKKKDEWGKWNILWDGWSLDGGVAYDNAGFNGVALLLGRRFGTLRDYLPLDYPLLKLFTVTFYPVGYALKYPINNLEGQVVSGISYFDVRAEF